MKIRTNVFLLVCLILLSGLTNAQSNNFFDYKEGLSNSLINAMHQDKKGFIWVATEDGLNRFDGIHFKTFFATPNDDNSLKNNFVTALGEDNNGNLLVGQINGLQIYHPESESFTEIPLYISDERIHLYISSIIMVANNDIWMTTSGYGIIRIDHKTGAVDYNETLNKQLCSQNLRVIFEDSNGVLWIGSENDGLNTYDPISGEVKLFTESSDNGNVLPSNNISSICEDDLGNIYVGSLKGGLIQIPKFNEQVVEIHSEKKDETILPVKSLLFDSKKRLWVGTDGFGLKRFNPENQLLSSFSPNTSPFDFAKSKIHCLIEDNGGNIWASIFQKGLFLFPESPEIFQHYGYHAFGENSIGSSCVTSIAGIDDKLWVGTDGDGLFQINRQNNSIKHVLLTGENQENDANNILTIHNGKDEYAWLGTYFNGLIRYNKRTGEIKNYKHDPENPNSISNDNITCIAEDRSGLLWLGTLGGGICRFDPKSETFRQGLTGDDELNSKLPMWVNTIFIDRKQNFWLGTYVGLLYYDVQNDKLKLFNTANGNINNNTVSAIQADRSGNIWAGTYSGLVRIDVNTFDTRYYNTEDGLCNNVVSAINEDEFGKIWISTHDGLSRFDPENNTFTNYYAYDGIQANEFYKNSTFRSNKNELFFGGINGMTEIKRNYLDYTRRIRDVLLTEFNRFNKPVEIGDKSGKHVILKKSIVLADTIRLHEKDNVFSIGFTSGELASQSRISYEYMMEGFDENWIGTNAQNRRATYTNLHYGTYTFKVRGVDKGLYSTPRKLTIIIYPLWYKTTWAKILWTLLLGTLFFGIVMFYKEMIQRRHLEKMNEMKMQFFINISHEIKTPLTLIIDPIEKLMLQKTDPKTSRLYNLIDQNAHRISRLVNQLMDVRRIDKGVILVKFQKTNLYNFIREIAQSYEILSAEKNIQFNIYAPDENIEVWIDPLNFEKVILNLLSNAFKFTPPEGSIELKITHTVMQTEDNKAVDAVKIAVSDTGVGIKETEIERIFNRFYQVESKDPSHRGGTGVGLHLSRALVNLHKGVLKAENKADGPGSRFIIELPLGNEHLPAEDIVTNENTLPAPIHRIHRQFFPGISKTEAKAEKGGKRAHKILVVDDEQEIRDYLTSELSEKYTVISAADGKHAFELLMEEKPSLVISDIMMPEMDGITLCKKIKGNMQTGHIPVVLLTALSKDENRAEGIETGADMYIVKPFSSEFIKKIIANLLENRKKVFEQLKAENGQFDVDQIELKSHDEILMEKVMNIIKDNISNEKLNVEMLAEGVGISRVHMHRKLKELTNQSARDFIRNIRMKQATYLLTNKKLTVSEVAYSLGYSNLSHFSNSFKSHYGMSPTEFASKQQTDQTI
ncbi:two-component regulator propeller domain-containing protein [Draconibacterium sp. IB214405]|uniref:hybrid sensor histidine kinase/response regulator transcription factor n=1 Tax=Draconibacterium sp. IB214405 TaxID=3097352 RepID=UPI002A0DCE48|nr:two-component regulator propeller domain-containing protein [Draconibacterium sp. IB214405]MDX8339596.1 two-component regulator propeller domain-containing protein [Draconibacterium sp. IB214405]